VTKKYCSDANADAKMLLHYCLGMLNRRLYPAGAPLVAISGWPIREPILYFCRWIPVRICQQWIAWGPATPWFFVRALPGTERKKDMKKFAYAAVMALALVAMISSFAIAGDHPQKGAEHAKKMTEKVKTVAGEMGECCVAAAKEDKGCCGKDAETVKAAYADFQAVTAVKADMHKCCATAMAAGKGCCGMEADALKADFTKKVAGHKAECAVKADMHECCAAAVAEGKGCCGKEAKELKADYDKKVEKAAKKLASK
jgi:hypothetical protein